MKITEEELQKVLLDNPDLKVATETALVGSKPLTGENKPLFLSPGASQNQNKRSNNKYHAQKVRYYQLMMEYPGAVISVNHYLARGRYGKTYVKPEVNIWKVALGWSIKNAHIEDWRLPLTVRCDGVFRDKRSTPDLSNLSKVILDAIQDATGINDRHMRWIDGDSKQDKKCVPHLILTIIEGG